MGGDHGASVVVAGAELSLARHPDAEMVFFGDQAVLDPLLAARPNMRESARVVHTDVAVRMDDKPSQALRHGRWRSSMWLAIDAVKKGNAGVAVSAGNTGALMAMAKFHLKTMAGIGRPAIAALWPTLRGESIVLDVGATIGADAQHLVELAIMGSAMARVVFDLDRPTVGLLNIGVEEVKGIEEIRDAHRILRQLACDHMDYRGFVEGDDIGQGSVDVVVTDWLPETVALLEGAASGGFLAPQLVPVAGLPFIQRARLAERHEIPRPVADQLGAHVAEDRLGARRQVGVAPLRVGFPNVFARGLDDVAEALLALGERRARLALLGDVAHHRLHHQAPALQVGAARGLHDQLAAVGSPQPRSSAAKTSVRYRVSMTAPRGSPCAPASSCATSQRMS